MKGPHKKMKRLYHKGYNIKQQCEEYVVNNSEKDLIHSIKSLNAVKRK